MTEATFIGVDLAWGLRNRTGLALMGWHERTNSIRLIDTDHLLTDKEILDWIRSRMTACTVIGIDAPIIAHNPPGTMRDADRLVQRNFAKYHAGVYPANRVRCARPVHFCRMLRGIGFSADPAFAARSRVRRQLEVYPHAAHAVFLQRKQIIKYKKGKLDDRRGGLKRFEDALISTLRRQHPALEVSPALDRLLALDPFDLNGGALKALEDQLDALLCAYMAWYYWFWTDDRCVVFGDRTNGYIICPRTGKR